MQDALQSLDELILSNPDVFEGYHLKYLVLTSLEKYEAAEETLDEAISLFPKDPAFAIDKASLMISKKEFHSAIAELRHIEDNYTLEVDDLHSIAMEKARAYALLEDMDGTIESLMAAKNIALSYDPPRMDLEALYLLMNCYLNNEDYQKTLECAQELLNCNN